MARGDPIQTSFNGGIQSPLLDGFIDAPRRQSSYADSKNLIALKQGPLVRRGGTRNVFELKPSTITSRTKLLEFLFNDEQAYILEVSGSTMRFYRNGSIIMDSSLDQTITAVSTATPPVITVASTAGYAADDRIAVSGLTEAVELNGRWGRAKAPSGTTITFFDEDNTTAVIGPAIAETSSTGLLQHVLTIAIPYNEAALFKTDGEFIPDVVQSNDVMYIAHEDFVTRVLSRTDHDVWSIDKLEYRNGPWQTKNDNDDTLTVTLVGGRVWNVVSSIADIVVTSDTLDAASGGDVNDLGIATETNRLIMFNFDGLDSELDADNNTWRWGFISKFVTTTNFEVTVPATAKNFPGPNIAANQDEWALGAYSDTTGYPSVIDIHEGRLVEGATTTEPRRVDFSASGGFNPTFACFTPHDEKLNVRPDDGISVTIGGGRADPIQWIKSMNIGLAVGTTGAEGVIRSSVQSESLTPGNASYKSSTTVGSASIQPLKIDNSLLFVQFSKRRLHELRYIFEDDGFAAPDMTELAENLTRGKIIQIAWQQQPLNTIWVLLSDGVLLGFTFERNADVLGWHTHVIGGTDVNVESIAVIPSTDLSRDELWLGVTRTISGKAVGFKSRTYIERMDRWYESDIEREAIYQQDSGLTFASAEVAITAATQADPVVITATTHGRADGDFVYIKEIVGMTEVNQRTFKVANKTANTFELNDSVDAAIDGTGFTAYVSGGTVQESVTNTRNFGSLDFLEGETVQVYADGKQQPDVVVGAGFITLANGVRAANFNIGFGTTWTFESHRVHFGTQLGTVQGKVKRLSDVVVRLFETLGFQHSPDGVTFDIVEFENFASTDIPAPLFTGDKVLSYDGGHDREGKLFLKGDGPFPVQLQATMPRVNTSKR